MSTESNEGVESKSCVQKPYNNYNIFFILERVRLIEARKQDTTRAPSPLSSRNQSQTSFLSGDSTTSTGYEHLEYPPLPSRYEHLETALPSNWFVPGKIKNSKRKHKASHGLISFQEIAKIAAANWRSIDRETKTYAETMAQIQKNRFGKLKAMEKANKGQYYSAIHEDEDDDSNSNSSPKKRKARDMTHVVAKKESSKDNLNLLSAAAATASLPVAHSHQPPPAHPHVPTLSGYDQFVPNVSNDTMNNYESNFQHPSNMLDPNMSNANSYDFSHQQHGQVNPGMRAPYRDALSLDQLFPAYEDNNSRASQRRSPCEEVDISDEEILGAYHSADYSAD